MSRGGLALALAALALIPGCVLPGDAVDKATPAEPRAANDRFGNPSPVFSLPDAPTARALEISLELDGAWAKPLDVVAARAEGAGLTHEWYVGLRDGRARVTYVDDVPYLTDADTSGSRYSDGEHIRHGPIAPRGRVDTGTLAPGSPPLALRFPVEGRFVMTGRGDSGALAVTVTPHVALGTPAYVSVSLSDGRTRFEPAEVDVHPGDAVTFLNVGRTDAAAVLRRSLVRLEAAGATALFSPVDEGTFDVAVVARDFAGGRGVATGRVVSDFERPPTRATFGPYSGSFVCTTPPVCDAEADYSFENEHPVRTARVNASASSHAGAEIVVSIRQDGREVARAPATENEGLVAHDLPAGPLTVRVTGASGMLAGYTVTVSFEYRLPLPP